MSRNPRRLRKPERLIVSVESATVAAVDRVMAQGSHHKHRNRSEFVRRAIERELVRCQSDDLETSTRA
jgi:metal-responsive CopG/Arc/MetJ family transcriptional regulator